MFTFDTLIPELQIYFVSVILMVFMEILVQVFIRTTSQAPYSILFH